MLIYNPAYDIYHTMYRIILLSSRIAKTIEIDKLKILDFIFKETDLLPDFLTDIFCNLLGYTRPAGPGDTFTLSREKHVEVDGKYAVYLDRQSGDVAALKRDEWKRMVDVNIHGVLNGIAAVLPRFVAQKSGHIVNVASVAAHMVMPTAAVYCGIKHAVHAITEGLRQEHDEIRSTLISPGVIATELGHDITDPDVATALTGWRKKSLTPDAIARAVCYALEQPEGVTRPLFEKLGLNVANVLQQIEAAIAKRAQELLEYVGIGRLADYKARTLSYGDQRRLEIVRALATKPKLLLLDEPAAGMNPQESLELMRLIQWIRDKFALSVLLVEHNMKVVMGISETVHVLDHGETIAIGTPGEIKTNRAVIEAYLGRGAAGGS